MFNDPKYCIELKLIQQTPMIHFQAYGGMTMGIGPRATEVKPKLDCFAQQWYTRNNPGETIPIEWVVEYDEKKHVNGKKPEHDISCNVSHGSYRIFYRLFYYGRGAVGFYQCDQFHFLCSISSLFKRQGKIRKGDCISIL